jgi:phospholipase/carboxylesterase
MSSPRGLGGGRPRPAAIVALSGFVPTVPDHPFDLTPPLPPVAIGHGAYDPVIGVEWGRQARALLEEAGADVLYRESPMQHSIDPTVMIDLRDWLADQVAGTTQR